VYEVTCTSEGIIPFFPVNHTARERRDQSPLWKMSSLCGMNAFFPERSNDTYLDILVSWNHFCDFCGCGEGKVVGEGRGS
jgi:hypothetical protein